MNHRPPYSFARVLKASKTLDPTWKLIWLEHRGLANGKGGVAIVSASTIAGRVGLSRKTVERARAELVPLGLLRKHERGTGCTDGWQPILPSDCRPHTVRITDDEAQALAERLDARIAQARKLAPVATSDTPCPSFEQEEAASGA